MGMRCWLLSKLVAARWGYQSSHRPVMISNTLRMRQHYCRLMGRVHKKYVRDPLSSTYQQQGYAGTGQHWFSCNGSWWTCLGSKWESREEGLKFGLQFFSRVSEPDHKWQTAPQMGRSIREHSVSCWFFFNFWNRKKAGRTVQIGAGFKIKEWWKNAFLVIHLTWDSKEGYTEITDIFGVGWPFGSVIISSVFCVLCCN